MTPDSINVMIPDTCTLMGLIIKKKSLEECHKHSPSHPELSSNVSSIQKMATK